MRAGQFLTALTLAGGAEDCTDRTIKLWLHIDLTSSFDSFKERAPAYLKEALTTLHEKYPNLAFGASGFGDRPSLPSGQLDNQCYVPAVEFSDPFGDAKFDQLEQFTKTSITPYTSLPEEDPLSGVPYIAHSKFGSYVEADDELRMLIVLTDAGPHYSPAWDGKNNQSSEQDFAKPMTEYVTCDPHYRWGTLAEIFDPVKENQIYPIFALWGAEADWLTVLNAAGYSSPDIKVLSGNYDPDVFTSWLIGVIDLFDCKPPPTDKPSYTTTSPTTPTTHSAEPTASTTDEQTPTASTTDEQTTTASTTDEQTTTASTTDEQTPSHPNDMIIVGASMGAAALLLAGGVYRLVTYNPPELDVEEESQIEPLGERANRENLVPMDERSFRP